MPFPVPYPAHSSSSAQSLNSRKVEKQYRGSTAANEEYLAHPGLEVLKSRRSPLRWKDSDSRIDTGFDCTFALDHP